MAFINWGNETPEQRAQRIRLEMEEISAIEEAMKHRRSTHHDMGNNRLTSSKAKGKAKARGGGSAEETE